MQVSLPLKEMTLSDKIRIMEDLWVDLSKDDSGYEPPEWHGEILKERKKRIESGELKFTDWETAKKEIKDRVS